MKKQTEAQHRFLLVPSKHQHVTKPGGNAEKDLQTMLNARVSSSHRCSVSTKTPKMNRFDQECAMFDDTEAGRKQGEHF